MPEKDYSHRDVLDKLGVRPGDAVTLVDAPNGELRDRLVDRVGRALTTADELADVVLIWADATTDAVGTLTTWKQRIEPSGGIWLLTPKRSQPGYVDQNELIEAGKLAGVVDNKVCSVSDTTSGMRFVIRKADRAPR